MPINFVWFKGHSCYKSEWAGFRTDMNITLIIGRNNTGKSHLLDLVRVLCRPGKLALKGADFKFGGLLDEYALQKFFQRGVARPGSYMDNWVHHGALLANKNVSWEYTQQKGVQNIQYEDPGYLDITMEAYRRKLEAYARYNNDRQNILSMVVETMPLPYQGFEFRHLLADRDIQPEKEELKLNLDENGAGATNIIRRYVNSSNPKYPRELVQDKLLRALNVIFGPDGTFTEITVQHHDGDNDPDIVRIGGMPVLSTWEVYLTESSKGLIPLSRSGSGLKTILLVLLNLLVVPEMNGLSKGQIVFAFEELENNLHPALLRRLLNYIEKFAVDAQCPIFLTTHSSIALDYFSLSKHTQVVRVTHDRTSAQAVVVETHFERLQSLSDLGARPSDLLQANGIIWVEGPSDRIYLNRWIDLFSDGTVQEGRDYQCAYYGGVLLAGVAFSSLEEKFDDFVNLANINPNVIVVCDSDRSSKYVPLKSRVARVQEECAKLPSGKGHSWITGTREIENYIPGELLSKVFGKSGLPDPDQYESFFPKKKTKQVSYIEKHLEKTMIQKVQLAMQVAPLMTLALLRSRFDLEPAMQELIAKIREWNS